MDTAASTVVHKNDRISHLKSEIWKKLNLLLEKQEKLKEEKKEQKPEVKDEETTFSPEEKPFLLEDFDDEFPKVNRSRRKNRQRTDEVFEIPAAPLHQDQSQAESITLASLHKTQDKLHKFHTAAADKYGVKNDIRLEIPISLDATISLPKNKESLEELLDFVMKHDAALLENYLRQKHHVGPSHLQKPQLLYPPPQDHHHPYEPTTVPDILHTGYAAIGPVSKDYGVPVKLSPAVDQESNHLLVSISVHYSLFVAGTIGCKMT